MDEIMNEIYIINGNEGKNASFYFTSSKIQIVLESKRFNYCMSILNKCTFINKWDIFVRLSFIETLILCCQICYAYLLDPGTDIHGE